MCFARALHTKNWNGHLQNKAETRLVVKSGPCVRRSDSRPISPFNLWCYLGQTTSSGTLLLVLYRRTLQEELSNNSHEAFACHFQQTVGVIFPSTNGMNTKNNASPFRKRPLVSQSLQATCYKLYTQQYVMSKDDNCQSLQAREPMYSLTAGGGAYPRICLDAPSQQVQSMFRVCTHCRTSVYCIEPTVRRAWSGQSCYSYRISSCWETEALLLRRCNVLWRASQVLALHTLERQEAHSSYGIWEFGDWMVTCFEAIILP